MGLTAAVVRIAGLEATFFRETEYVGYSIVLDKSEPGYPKPIQGNWPGLPWDHVDAAVNWNNGKLFFFNGPQCLSFDVFQNKADAGEPKAIKAEWPGVPWDAVDAVVLWNNGKAYFFKGTEYVRFDVSQHRVDAGYPQPIKGHWPGMPWDRIDTVVNWGNGKAYFFRDQEDVRYDLAADKVDPGYPTPIVDHWPGVLPVTVRTMFDVKKHGFHFVNDSRSRRDCSVASASRSSSGSVAGCAMARSPDTKRIRRWKRSVTRRSRPVLSWHCSGN